MPRASIDFTGTESTGYLKDGTYRVRLQDVEERDGREFPLWVWIVASVEPDTFGRTARHTTSLSPKAAYFVRQTIEAFGGEVPAALARVNTDNYLGREAMAVVVQDGTFVGDDGQDHPRYKVGRLFPVLDGQPPIQAPTENPLSPEAEAQFRAAEDDIPF